MAEGEHQIDLSDCDREPIHRLGAIQPIGFLVAVSDDWRVRYVSDNVERFAGRPASVLIGRELSELFDREALHQLRNSLFQLDDPDGVSRLFGVALLAERPERSFDCAVHRAGDAIIVEAEPSEVSDASEVAGLVKAMIGRVEATQEPVAFLRQGALQIQALTGFDRVMVYRFRHDGSGEVVAEMARGGIPSLLGLRFPATDIPKQARELYLRSPFRIICDVEAVPARILCSPGDEGAPLDLSLSILRAVSPIHIQYLKNMDVCASMSISIIVEGKLWGLFACHNRTPRCPSFEMRTLAELFTQMFAMKLEARERRAIVAFERAARVICDDLMAAVANDVGLLSDAKWMAETIGGLMPCDGVAIRMNGRTAGTGAVPLEIGPILAQVDALGSGRIFSTDHLAGLGLGDTEGNDAAAGVLAIPISRPARDYVMLFRRPTIQTVTWAGDPRKPVANEQLSPRASFAAWCEEVRDRAEPFTEAELAVAEALRVSLIEVVMRMTAAAVVERQRATERQELLIAELNHRVRNILALISGLITRSRDGEAAGADYTELLEGRVQALARAHDQITQDNWAPARLRQLFETEGGSATDGGRLKLSGTSVLLEPTAFTTLALVVHELMTNSWKHGALSGDGFVSVHWTCDTDGSLDIRWLERGGPPVQPPRRYGLGRTIIERSVPHDLGGTAHASYAPDGFEARFTVPARHVRVADNEAQPAIRPVGPEPRSVEDRPLHDAVLLVEDSLIIALHVREMLLGLGATEVIVASSVAAALAELDRARPSFAILDINLGVETSFPVADRLRDERVPFVFATGYGNQLRTSEAYADVAVVQKPYNRANLAAVLRG